MVVYTGAAVVGFLLSLRVYNGVRSSIDVPENGVKVVQRCSTEVPLVYVVVYCVFGLEEEADIGVSAIQRCQECTQGFRIVTGYIGALQRCEKIEVP